MESGGIDLAAYQQQNILVKSATDLEKWGIHSIFSSPPLEAHVAQLQGCWDPVDCCGGSRARFMEPYGFRWEMGIQMATYLQASVDKYAGGCSHARTQTVKTLCICKALANQLEVSNLL